MNVFDHINFFIKNTESSFVNLLSSVAPWAAPLAPAYMSFDHMTKNLHFPEWIAWSIAIVVEIVGLSTISTGMMFWHHNRRERAKKNQVPLGLVIGTFVFYLFVIFTINVVLDLAPKDDVVIYSLARSSLILLTIPAALLIAMRTQHTEIINELQEEKRQKTKEKLTQNFHEIYTNYPSDLPFSVTDWRKLSQIITPEHERWIMETDINVIANLFGVTRKTVYNWRDHLTN